MDRGSRKTEKRRVIRNGLCDLVSRTTACQDSRMKDKNESRGFKGRF
jgi:hypothetical protein